MVFLSFSHSLSLDPPLWSSVYVFLSVSFLCSIFFFPSALFFSFNFTNSWLVLQFRQLVIILLIMRSYWSAQRDLKVFFLPFLQHTIIVFGLLLFLCVVLPLLSFTPSSSCHSPSLLISCSVWHYSHMPFFLYSPSPSAMSCKASMLMHQI